MEKKRPNGIIVLASFIILGSVFTLASVPMAFRIVDKIPLNFQLILNILIAIISIYVAINLIRQKEWARKSIIYIAIIIIVSSSIYFLQAIKTTKGMPDKDFLQSLKTLQEKHPLPDMKFSEQELREMIPTAKKVGLRWVIINFSIQLIFNIIVLFYFTRPKAKEQFK